MRPIAPLLAALAALPSAAQTAPPAQSSEWKLPPPEVVKILDARPSPALRLSPDARWMLLVERPAMPSLADVMRPWIGLAGIRVDPAANARHQTLFDTGLVLRAVNAPDGAAAERRIALPDGARLAALSWSHTSTRFAFTLLGAAGLELYAVEVASATPVRVAGPLNGVFSNGFEWMPDGERLLVHLVPAERGPAPERPSVPSGPVIQETAGTSTPLRTWQDLLQDAHDEALFEHYGRAQLAIVDPRDLSSKLLGKPELYADLSPSPDEAYLLVERIQRPYSYVLPAALFPRSIEVRDAAGLLVKTVAEVPLAEHIPQEGVRTEPRSVRWQASAAATLVWAEALDGGDPKRPAEWRDKWMEWPAPFAAEPREILRLAGRAQGLQWLADASRALAGDYDRDRRWRRSLLFDLAHPDQAPLALDDRSSNDRYKDPGSPLSVPTASGWQVLRQDGPWIYRAGGGAAPEGARPFLDRMNIATGASERLWQCAEGVYEYVAAVAASALDRKPVVVTSRESPSEPPNYWLRDLQAGSARPLTAFPDPTPELRGITKELVRYPRADGVELSGTLYLPAGYAAGTRLPLVVWAYPMEYLDAGTAGQVASSPWRFVQMRGPSELLFLTQGYAVLDDAAMPVVGDPETVNDSFLDQIVASARAAIEAMAARGVADPGRVGVGGHSYGAFMTANLLAHSDLFRAGIARSGAYNRTLTPFGFQAERRTLWEAPEAYVKLSPFLAAHEVDEPILLIHGEKDSNQGTFPIQSERFYQALKGNGANARFVLLPGEDHGYRARESVMHVSAEMLEWFGRHVKGAAAPGQTAAPVEAAAHTAGSR